jgi:hypothetical protein
MSRFRKIFVKMWGDDKFRRLSAPGPNAQTLWFNLLTGPQTTRIPGLLCAGEAGFAEKIGWSLEDFRKVFLEISSKEMVRADWKAHLIWIPKAICYNSPESPNVVKGWKDTWEEMPECELKLEAFHELECFFESLGEPFVTAFREACSKPFGNPSRKPLPKPFGKPSGKPFRKAFGKPLPNQEQEQEQEQEKNLPPSEDGIKNSITKKSYSSSEIIKSELQNSETCGLRSHTHPRLQIFLDEYLLAKGHAYVVGDFRVEGGAAQRTQSKIPDENTFRRAVRAYLENNNKRLTENGHPFLWFIRDLNRWAIMAQGDTHARKDPGKYDGLCE